MGPSQQPHERGMAGRKFVVCAEYKVDLLAPLLHPDRGGDNNRLMPILRLMRLAENPSREPVGLNSDLNPTGEYRDARYKAVQGQTEVCRAER